MQPGIDAVDGNLTDRLVFCHRLAIEGRYVCNVSLDIQQVNVRILIDNNQPLGLRIPGYMDDIDIAESIDLIVSGDAVVIQVIAVETVGGTDKQVV